MVEKKKAKNKPSRMTAPVTKYTLWAKAAGRCQFSGCNKLLYCSEITLEPVNIADNAHIYSFEERGPRRHDGIKLEKINDVDNLMLLCKTCHKTIDNNDGKQYPIELLKAWKHEHETRVRIVTGIDPNRKTLVVVYTAAIDRQNLHLNSDDLLKTLFPQKYPISPNPIDLSLKIPIKDNTPIYWEAESASLRQLFESNIPSEISRGASDFTIFAIAPQPLLILLGTLFSDKRIVEVRQLMREPQTWTWQMPPKRFKLQIKKPDHPTGNAPALNLSISAHINNERIAPLVKEGTDIWTITPEGGECGNDIIRCPEQLSHFRKVIRVLIKQMMEQYGMRTPLHIFPAMPVSCAVELGRIRMPKADMPWLIYDQPNNQKSFSYALSIGDNK